MKKIIIYSLLLAFNTCVWAQTKLKGFPSEEIRIYYLPANKDIKPKNMTWENGAYWIGESKAAVLSSLNAVFSGVKISKSDGGDRDIISTTGLGISFQEQNINHWYDIFMPYNKPENYFLISTKYLIHPGSPIRQKLLDEVEYRIYSLGDKLTDQQAAALDKSIEREYSFYTTMGGDLVENILTITVKDGIIQEVNIGYSE